MKTTLGPERLALLRAAVMAAVFTVLGFACSTVKTEQERLAALPFWKHGINEQELMIAYGMATRASQDLSVTAATANAYLELAHQMDDHVIVIMSDFRDDDWANDSQFQLQTGRIRDIVVSHDFSRVSTAQVETREVRKDGGRRYTSYVRLELPRVVVDRNIHAAIKQQPDLYEQLLASRAFAEFERKLAGGDQQDASKQESE